MMAGKNAYIVGGLISELKTGVADHLTKAISLARKKGSSKVEH